MTRQLINSVENNFTKGLITEFTGLNFPENAATDTTNCEFTLVGDVVRREGINIEVNGVNHSIPTTGFAVSEYVWNNPGGDGNSKLLVKQAGPTIWFYDIAASTIAAPLSSQLLGAVTISSSVVAGQTYDSTSECQFADGNGYLFVYQKTIEPSYVTYNSILKTFTLNAITVLTRDFQGVIDGLPVNTRPSSLTNAHQYNLQNQGWTSGNAWAATSTTLTSVTNGPVGFTVAAGIAGITNGAIVTISGPANFGGNTITASGTVTSYSGTNLVINVTTSSSGSTGQAWTITPLGAGYLAAWFAVEGNYPSNADVWWYFKNPNGVFDPTDYAGNVTLATGNAPQGHYLLNAFNLDRSSASGVTGLTTVATTTRPTTGAWFQGRVWYTGVNAAQIASSTSNFYTWTENIYCSTVVSDVSDFGSCFQTNDPSSETLNGILPTDGGVITIVGSGTIHKLWPVANGLLVFANNGVWFITGSQGIGFAANDYTITKISSIKVLSAKSFVDVLGLPYFWNEEGIYQTMAGQNGQLSVEPLTVGTILSFYNQIPLASKKYVRGAYDPIDYRIQWVYRSTLETNITSRYTYDSILNYNVYNKAFYPYLVSPDGVNGNHITGIQYVSYPYIATQTPLPGFKYGSTTGAASAYAEEYDTTFVDWGNANFVSYFITGYKVHGKGLFKFQVPYIVVFNRNIANYIAYYVQGIWDYATSSDSNRYSVKIFTEILDANHGVSFKKHKIRGHGLTLQLKFTSVDGQPFDFIGWATFEALNAGI